MTKVMTPSPITAGQIGKAQELLAAALRKSSFSSEGLQTVLEEEGVELVDEVLALLQRRVAKRTLTPFDPAAFIGKGWKFGERNVRTAEVGINDLQEVKLVTHLAKGEEYTTGEERRKRLSSAAEVPLGADHFLWYWQNQDRIPKEWKEKTGGNTTYVFFDGDELVSPDGCRYALSLYWRDGQWYWGCHWLDFSRGASYPSAVVASA